jgi:hypothetical protein
MFSVDIDESGIIICTSYLPVLLRKAKKDMVLETGKIETERSLCRDFAFILLSRLLLPFFSCKLNTLNVISVSRY